VGKALAILLLVLPCCCARAQEQERKLIDRIMKPDMTLENDAQKKKFTADRTSVNKQAHVSTFYLEQKSAGKKFSGTRDFSSGQFATGNFNQTDKRSARDYAGNNAATPTYSEAPKTASTHTVHDQNKASASHDYASNRPYLEKGKSQKFLNRKNKPMTIDEVRDLLNKNK
jgi:hypothetical protein